MVNKDKERYYGVDILRIIATFCVIGVHFFLNTNYYDVDPGGFSMRIQSIIRNFCMICVPLFIVISGYLNKNKEYNKSFFKKLFNILIIWFFYSLIEYFVLNIINGTYTDFNLKSALYAITTFKGCEYSWYIEMYIGLYLLSPILNNAFDSLNDKNKDYLFIIAIIMFILPSFINTLFINIIHIPCWWATIYPVGYYITGKYINYKQFNFKKKNLFILLVLTQIITFSYTYIGTINYDSLTTYISTIIVFLIFYNVNIKRNFSKNILKYISSICLDIYLASSLIDKIIYPVFNNQMNLHSINQSNLIVFMPLVVFTVFIISSIYGSVRKLIINVR